MKIIGTEKEINLISQLCDSALKQGGIRNLPAVEIILNSTHIEKASDESEIEQKEKTNGRKQ